MKVLHVAPVRLTGRRELPDALGAVFGPDMLRKVHGPSTRVGPFDASGRRTFTFAVKLQSVPLLIRRFFCGEEVGVTTRQAVKTHDPARYTIHNDIKMHFVGANLFKIRPSFVLERSDDGIVTLTCRVRHNASLPPPLNGIAERFMATSTHREVQHFVDCLRDAGIVVTEGA